VSALTDHAIARYAEDSKGWRAGQKTEDELLQRIWNLAADVTILLNRIGALEAYKGRTVADERDYEFAERIFYGWRERAESADARARDEYNRGYDEGRKSMEEMDVEELTYEAQADDMSIEQLEENVARWSDLANWMWTIICNVSEGNWERQSMEWQTAARKARDEYHALLPSSLSDMEAPA